MSMRSIHTELWGGCSIVHQCCMCQPLCRCPVYKVEPCSQPTLKKTSRWTESSFWNWLTEFDLNQFIPVFIPVLFEHIFMGSATNVFSEEKKKEKAMNSELCYLDHLPEVLRRDSNLWLKNKNSEIPWNSWALLFLANVPGLNGELTGHYFQLQIDFCCFSVL